MLWQYAMDAPSDTEIGNSILQRLPQVRISRKQYTIYMCELFLLDLSGYVYQLPKCTKKITCGQDGQSVSFSAVSEKLVTEYFK